MSAMAEVGKFVIKDECEQLITHILWGGNKEINFTQGKIEC
jgi:hypothetical protein